tara:strand:+ start:1774 stop:1959 length:186 start_codon:yes stop_codon:yes gene_type:complete
MVIYMNHDSNHSEALGNVCTNCGDDDQFGAATFAPGENDLCINCCERVLAAMTARPALVAR